MYKLQQTVRAQDMSAVITVLIKNGTIVTNTCISSTTPASWFPYAFQNTKPLSWNALISSLSTGNFLIHNSNSVQAPQSSFLTLLNLNCTIKKKHIKIKTPLISFSTNFSTYFNYSTCETSCHLLFTLWLIF